MRICEQRWRAASKAYLRGVEVGAATENGNPREGAGSSWFIQVRGLNLKIKSGLLPQFQEHVCSRYK